MSSSEPKNDRPCELLLLVFTNSRDDYAVTVRVPADAPPDRMQRTAQWIDALARRCDAWLARGGATLVGVVPSPDRADHALAVRVFDVGEFRGRPHTLAIVAVELPPDWLAGHSAARLLAALSPPVPDADHYQIPTDPEIRISPITAEPFASLDAWQRSGPQHNSRQGSGRQRLPSMPAMFSQPPEFAAELTQFGAHLRASGGGSLRRRRLVIFAVLSVTIVSAALAATFAWISFMKSIPTNEAPRAHPLGYTREQLLSCLTKSGVQMMPEMNEEQAAIAIIETAPILEERMRALSAELAPQINKASRTSLATVLRRHRLLWMAPVRAAPAPDLVLNAAIPIHQAYQGSLRILDALEKLNPASPQFAIALVQLWHCLRDLDPLQSATAARID